ncbi:MAG: lamin tail domain-containing protein [Defluviitaleaceae bacterium]|nr:lamin tail domain-containing protein [Defluviitaleaceae bacterium]
MVKKATIQRFLALVLAMVMALSSFTSVAVSAEYPSADANEAISLDTTSPPAISVPSEDDTTSPPSLKSCDCLDLCECEECECGREDCELCNPDCDCGLEDCEICNPDCDCGLEDCEICNQMQIIDGMFVGIAPEPILSHLGGVYNSSFNLSISPDPRASTSITRFQVDGSAPTDCGGPRNTATGRCYTPDQYVIYNPTLYPSQDLWWPPECGCSWILGEGVTIPINFDPVWRYYSPMSMHGVGRANPGDWNVPWATRFTPSTAYVSPNNTEANWTAGPATLRHPSESDPNQGQVFSGSDTRPPRGNTRMLRQNLDFNGYYTPSPIYNGRVIRARSFDVQGTPGRMTTQTYIVNVPAANTQGYSSAMSWSDVRIFSIVLDPQDVVHPIRGFYRNWDRGFDNSYNGSWTSNSAGVWTQRTGTMHWVPGNYENWINQIQAGMWDGRTLSGAQAPILAPGATHPGNNNGQGWGLTVNRRPNGSALDMGDQDGSRPLANIEVYSEAAQTTDANRLVNQTARVWTFGNWSRMLPLRSIRVNFNQGAGDVVGVPDLIPNTRRHYYASNERLGNFRHVNLRQSDVEGTDLRDPLSMILSQPLRPTVQNATWTAVFINGEFWGMNNMQAHRHEYLVSQIFNVPTNMVQLEDEGMFMDLMLQHVIHSGTLSTNATTWSGRGVNVDNSTSTSGTRRTALGANGYARTTPSGATHLTKEWYDHLNTIFDMDDLIDNFIVAVHFENWDWVDNNVAMWRTTSVIPGSYGGDGRWRFIVQDFDNAIFHGANNMLDFYTAMTSAACRDKGCGCAQNGDIQRGHATNPRASWTTAQQLTHRGEVFHPNQAGLPMDIMVNNPTYRRAENAARVYRVLLQNPYFRNHFAARYSTYSGTVFHPTRVQSVINDQVTRSSRGGASPVLGRHHRRWGLMTESVELGNGGWGPLLAPWVGTNAQRTASETSRVNLWLGTSTGRWEPHTLRAPNGTVGDPNTGNPPFPTNSRLRSQQNVLFLRASYAAASNDSQNQNAIEHMRHYFSRPTTPSGNTPMPSGLNGTTSGPWYRENVPGPSAGLGSTGANVRISWNVTGGPTGDAADGKVGWLSVGGAEIRRDLFVANDATWPFGGALPSGLGSDFTTFQPGAFSARYLQNMPIEVKASALPGFTFSNFSITGPTGTNAPRVYVGGTLSENGMSITGGQQITSLTNINQSDTIWLIPGTGGTGTSTTGAITVTANFTNAPATAIIHQVYGNGGEGSNAVSHGFIELYNPTSSPINLTGQSLQVQISTEASQASGNAPAWNVFPLSGTLAAGQSYLVVSNRGVNTNADPNEGHVPRYIIPSSQISTDRTWDLEFSNRNMSVALVNGTTALPAVLPQGGAANVYDLVGVVNSIGSDRAYNFWGASAAHSISRQRAVRRVWAGNTPANQRNNYLDFMEVHYGEANRGEIEFYKPQHGARQTFSGTARAVSVVGGAGARVFPTSVRENETVGFNAGRAPIGKVFNGWTATGGVTIVNPNSQNDAYFVSPGGSGAITVTANFADLSVGDSIVINQIFGQGGPSRADDGRPTSENSVSHGFIELRNPTGRNISLGGMSLQIMNDNDGNWRSLTLPNRFVEPGKSFLIVSTDWAITAAAQHSTGHVPRLILTDWDFEWSQRFSNSAMSVALVTGTSSLPNEMNPAAWNRVLDMVGARNSSSNNMRHFLGEAPAESISRQRAVRRVANTMNNVDDFIEVDYRLTGTTDAQLEQLRPRHHGAPGASQSVTIVGGGMIGSGAAPSQNVGLYETVSIYAGWNGPSNFVRWSVLEGDVTLADPLSPETTFGMGSSPVVIRAIWDDEDIEIVHTSDPYDIVFEYVPPPSPYIFDLQEHLAPLPNGDITNGTSHLIRTHEEAIVLTVGGSGTSRNVTVQRNVVNATRGIVLRNVPFQAGDVLEVRGNVIQVAASNNMRLQPNGSPITTVVPVNNDEPNANVGIAQRTGGGNAQTGAFTLTYTIPAAIAPQLAANGIRIIINSSSGAAATGTFRIDDMTVLRPSLMGASEDEAVISGFSLVDESGEVVYSTNDVSYDEDGQIVTGFAEYSISPSTVPGVYPNLPIETSTLFTTLPTVLADGVALPVSRYNWYISDFGGSFLSPTVVTFNATNTAIRSSLGGTARVRYQVLGESTVVDPGRSNLAVSGGTSSPNSTSIEVGSTVTLTANTPPTGQVFSHWSVVSGPTGFTIRDSHKATGAYFNMPNADVSVTANFTSQTLNSAIPIVINQIYGSGGQGENSVSHGFIELRNPTGSAVQVHGYSLQIANGPAATSWTVIPIPNMTMAANSSYLIVSTAWSKTSVSDGHIPRLILSNWDLPTEVQFNNNNMSVALVSGATPLTAQVEWSRVVDLVGVYNDMPDDTLFYLGSGPARQISRQVASRRISGNTRNNAADFEPIDYRLPTGDTTPNVDKSANGINNTRFNVVRPRSSAGDLTPRAVNVNSEGAGARSNPASVVQGATATLYAGAPLANRVFTNFTSTGITITNSTNGSAATFVTPAGSGAINVNANWSNFNTSMMAPQSLVVTQVYGNGGTADGNAVSHGFIEIYNPTNANIALGGKSVQVQMNGVDGRTGDNTVAPAWQVITLPAGNLAPSSSFLIVSDKGITPDARHVINPSSIDFTTPITFSNRNISVAIVNNTTQLPDILNQAAYGNIADLVGVINEQPTTGVEQRDRLYAFLGSVAAERVSRSEAARRTWVSGALVNTRNNGNDFQSVRYADDAEGMTNAEVDVYRPRGRNDSPWTTNIAMYEVTTTGTPAVISPSGPQMGGRAMSIVVTAPTGQRFSGGAGDVVQVMGAGLTVTLVIDADRRSATGEFSMPSANVVLNVNPPLEALPPLLAEFTVTNTVHGSVGTGAGSSFAATTGAGTLTAWSNGSQIQIGTHGAGATAGTARTPIVINNAAIGTAGWRGASTAADVGNATAYQVQFNATGFSNLTLSASQKSTGSGPLAFQLAYRTNTTGAWTIIPGSNVTVVGVANDGYDALVKTYMDFDLPAALNNQGTVQLRVFYSGANLPQNGNTSLNNIEIRGTSASSRTVTINLNGGTQSGTPVALTQTVPSGGLATAPTVVREGWIHSGWTTGTGAAFSFSTGVTADVTVTAQWLRLGAVSSNGTGSVSSADVVWLARSVANHAGFPRPAAGTPQFDVADINGDGQLNAADITALMRWLVGYELSVLRDV